LIPICLLARVCAWLCACREELQKRRGHFDVIAFGIWDCIRDGPNNFAPFDHAFRGWADRGGPPPEESKLDTLKRELGVRPDLDDERAVIELAEKLSFDVRRHCKTVPEAIELCHVVLRSATQRGVELQEQAKAEAEQQLARAQQDSTMAGLAQGLDFLRTRCVDLSDERFGDVSPDQALAIATKCGPKLDALFLRVPKAVPSPIVGQLRQACPDARCLALGGEVTQPGFEEILRQCATADAELGDALGLAATSIAEGVPPASASTLDPEPEPEYAADMEPEPEGAVGYAAGEPEPELLEPEPEGTTTQLAAPGGAVAASSECFTLDLTDPQFQHLTDAGLGTHMPPLPPPLVGA
jgi:hypothetical protein